MRRAILHLRNSLMANGLRLMTVGRQRSTSKMLFLVIENVSKPHTYLFIYRRLFSKPRPALTEESKGSVSKVKRLRLRDCDAAEASNVYEDINNS